MQYEIQHLLMKIKTICFFVPYTGRYVLEIHFCTESNDWYHVHSQCLQGQGEIRVIISVLQDPRWKKLGSRINIPDPNTAISTPQVLVFQVQNAGTHLYIYITDRLLLTFYLNMSYIYRFLSFMKKKKNKTMKPRTLEYMDVPHSL